MKTSAIILISLIKTFFRAGSHLESLRAGLKRTQNC